LEVTIRTTCLNIKKPCTYEFCMICRKMELPYAHTALTNLFL